MITNKNNFQKAKTSVSGEVATNKAIAENANNIKDAGIEKVTSAEGEPKNANYYQLSNFNSFKDNRYSDPAFAGSYGFVFLTKPALFLCPDNDTSDYLASLAFENMTKNKYLSQFILSENQNKNDNYIIKSLSYKPYNDITSYFLPIFTNNILNFNIIDYTIDTTEAFNTKEGYRMILPTNSTQSRAAGQISLNVYENSNMDVFKYINIWMNYIDDISNGTLSANPQMIKNNMLDYTASIYYFVISPDGYTIKYYAEYVGVYPTNFPTSTLSYTKGSVNDLTYDIPFTYMLKLENNPTILEDFNLVSTRKVSPVFTNETFEGFLNEIDASASRNYGANAYEFTKSPYLDKSQRLLKDYLSVSNRNPVVYYEPKSTPAQNKSSAELPGRYVLSFGNTSLMDYQAQNLTDNYYEQYILGLLGTN